MDRVTPTPRRMHMYGVAGHILRYLHRMTKYEIFYTHFQVISCKFIYLHYKCIIYVAL